MAYQGKCQECGIRWVWPESAKKLSDMECPICHQALQRTNDHSILPIRKYPKLYMWSKLAAIKLPENIRNHLLSEGELSIEDVGPLRYYIWLHWQLAKLVQTTRKKSIMTVTNKVWEALSQFNSNGTPFPDQLRKKAEILIFANL